MPKSTREKPQEPGGYVPPSNLEAEQAILGSILVRPSVLDEICDTLFENDFYREAHGRIFHAMMDLYGADEPVDLVTVTAYLKDRGQLEGVGGPVFLAALSEQVGFATNATYYARVVREKAMLRRLLDTTQEIASACFAPVENVAEFIDAAECRIFEVTHGQVDTKYQSVGEIGRADYDRMEAYHERGEEAHGLRTNFYDLDRMTAGLHPGEETVLASRPGMGKTSLAMNIAWNVGHKLKEPVAIFSLEMSKEQLIRRIISSAGRIDGENLRRCTMTPTEWALRTKLQVQLDDAPIWIDEKAGLSALELRARCRRIKARHGLSLVIVDYLQLMREPGRARSRDEAVSSNAYSIKELSKELSVSILLLCQVNRDIEKEKRKKYRMSDLRESGAVEQAADNIWFLWRDEDAVQADFTLAKQRNGPVGRFQLTYSPAFTRFDNHASV